MAKRYLKLLYIFSVCLFWGGGGREQPRSSSRIGNEIITRTIWISSSDFNRVELSCYGTILNESFWFCVVGQFGHITQVASGADELSNIYFYICIVLYILFSRIMSKPDFGICEKHAQR